MMASKNRITISLGALLLGAGLLTGPGAAQVTPEMIDELADGLEEFMPDAAPPGAAPAPQTDTADAADTTEAGGFEDFGTLDGWGDMADEGEAPEAPAPGTAEAEAAAEPSTEPASRRDIPGDWQRHEHFGLSAAFPADFELLDESRREISYARVDFDAQTAIIVGFSTEADLLPDEADIVAQESVELANGSLFTRYEIVIDDDELAGVGMGLMQQPDIPGQPTVALIVMLLNLDWTDEKRQLAETILASIEAAVPVPERQRGLDGLLSYTMPDGWRSQRERDNFLDLIRGHMEGPVLQFVTGEPGRDMASLTRRVQDRSAVMRGEFTESRGEILGHPARIFEGDSGWVSGWQSVLYLLETCAPGNEPIVIHAALRSEDQQAQIDAFLAHAAIHLPDGAAPCPEAMGPGTTWSRDGRFAIGEIEGLEGSAGPFMMSVRPADRDQRHPQMRVLFDQPRYFNETFQLGNRFGAFANPPFVHEIEVAGHRAHGFLGHGEANGQRWDFAAYLLDTCLADDTPILITRTREVVDPLAELSPDPMTEALFIDLPDDAHPCDPALLQDALARVEAELAEETAPADLAPEMDPAVESITQPAPDMTLPQLAARPPEFQPLVFEGRLDNDHRRQRYAIDLPANGTLRLDVTTGEGLNLYQGVRLFDSDGETELFRQHHGSDRQRAYEVTHLRARRYYLDLIKDSRAFYEGDYRVGVQFRPVSVPGDPEPNDEPGQATTLELGALVSGHLGFRGQGREVDGQDWYAIDLPQDDTLVLHVTTSGGGEEPIRPDDGSLNLYGGVFVYAADGETRLHQQRHPPGHERAHEIEDLEAGRYYIRIMKDPRDSYWGSYTLHARTAGMPAPAVPDPWPWSEPHEDEGAAAPAPAATQEQGAGAGWTRYVNARFGTVVQYPAGLFDALPPPGNDDGRAFAAPDGSAAFHVFAGHNVFEQSLDELASEAADSAAIGEITRLDVLADRAVIEGERDGRVVLHVILDEPGAGIVHHLFVDYDSARAALYAPITVRMAESLTIETPAAALPRAPEPSTTEPRAPEPRTTEPRAPMPAPDPAPYTAPAPETPEGWQRHAHFGLSFAIPPGFALFEETEDEASYLGNIDFQAESYVAIHVSREYHPDLFDAPEVFAPEPLTLADGSRFTRFEMAFVEPDWSRRHIGLAQHPDDAEQSPVLITVARGNAEWDEETRALARQILASVERIAAPAETAPAPDQMPAPAPAPAPESGSEPDEVELIFWQSIADSRDPADFQAYLDRWPQGVFAALAKNRLRQLTAQVLPPTPSADPDAYTTPAVGSPERTAIMDAARIPISERLGQQVVFVVSTLRSSGSWAYLSAVPHLPDGRPLDWSRTPYRDAWEADAMSDLVLVLLVNDGSGWRALRHIIGPTDVAWYYWVEELGLPEALFFGDPDALP